MSRSRTRSLLLASTALLALFAAPTAGRSGEISSPGGSCEPSGTASRACTWKPSKCKKPDGPMLYVASTAEFNRAAEALNKFAGELNAYMKCIAEEAQSDVNASVALIKAGMDKTQADAMAEFNRNKSQLEAARLRQQLQ